MPLSSSLNFAISTKSWTLAVFLLCACGGKAVSSQGSGNETGESLAGADDTTKSGGGATASDELGEDSVGIPDCTNPSLVDGVEICEDGYLHRVSAEEQEHIKPSPRVAGACGKAEEGDEECECLSDADCSADEPYCVQFTFGDETNLTCKAGCKIDSDCDTDFICVPGRGIGSCVSATCSTDDDCPGDARCASYQYFSESCRIETAYSCQSPDDTCSSLMDCNRNDGICDGSGGHRVCVAHSECRP